MGRDGITVVSVCLYFIFKLPLRPTLNPPFYPALHVKEFYAAAKHPSGHITTPINQTTLQPWLLLYLSYFVSPCIVLAFHSSHNAIAAAPGAHSSEATPHSLYFKMLPPSFVRPLAALNESFVFPNPPP